MSSISVSGKNWKYKNYNQEEINYLKDNYFLDEITSKLLSIRKIKRDEITNFLNPSIKNFLPNPEVLIDMKKTTQRIMKSIEKNEKIGIFGDYDVDGASSAALLGNYFHKLNLSYETYIPNRIKEGYGPSKESFENLIKKGVKIILTVDCGSMSYDAIQFAKSKKIDVIVLDHHQTEINLPDAFSIINPNRFDDKSNLNYLCAAGVTFIFLVSLNKELRSKNWFQNKNLNEPNLLEFLDLVSLATVCDVVPLVGLNRALVSQGLKVLGTKKNLGLKTLIDICKIENNPNIYHLGYVIGPRINAGGRVGKSSHGVNLLLKSDPKEVFQIASELDQFNSERKLLEEKVYKNILVEADKLKNESVIVVSGTNWHEGVIGIVASRIKDKFNKPVIIISIENNIGKASARSIVGFDIGSVIISGVQQRLLIKGGGHKMAGGFSIKLENIEKFREFIIRKFSKINENTNERKSLLLDSVITSSAINLDFYQKIYLLAPFGSGNPEPKFAIESLKVVNSKIINEKHIKSILIDKAGLSINTIAFNSVDKEIAAYLLKKNNKLFNIAGKLSLNEWRGKSNVEFIIDDISVNKNVKNMVPSSIG